MFLEQNGHNTNKKGWIEVITGSMFSGKTEELIRRVNRVIIAGQEVIIFKPSIDKRYDSNKIISHGDKTMPSVMTDNADDILSNVAEQKVIAIDEVQFFENKIIDICRELANKRKRVIVAGLDMDYKGKPFGPMPHIMAIAEYITKLHAICTKCGQLAQYSYRISNEKERILLGDEKEYTALCRECYNETIN